MCIAQVFDMLPVAALVNQRVLCVHGGIGRVDTIDQIRAIRRPLKIFDSEVLADLMWSDPTMDHCDGFVEPSRVRGEGVGCVEFGPDVVRAFCARNNVSVIVRGHQVCCAAVTLCCLFSAAHLFPVESWRNARQVAQRGYDLFAGGHLITVFSATNYCNVQHNDGAMLHMLDTGSSWRLIPKYIDEDQRVQVRRGAHDVSQRVWQVN